MSLQDDEIQLKRLKLKLAINKQLRQWGRYYTNALRLQMRFDEDLYASVVDEMEREGMLLKEQGRNGAVILVYRDMTVVSHV
jgi:hypothetical protein